VAQQSRSASQYFEALESRLRRIESSVSDVNNQVGSKLAALEETTKRALQTSVRRSAEASQAVARQIDALSSMVTENTTAGAKRSALETAKLKGAIEILSSHQTDSRKHASSLFQEINTRMEQELKQIAEITNAAQRSLLESTTQSSQQAVQAIEARLREFEKSLTGDAGVHSEISKAHQALTSLSQGTQKSNRALFDLVASKLAELEGKVAGLPAQSQALDQIASDTTKAHEFAAQLGERVSTEIGKIEQKIDGSGDVLKDQIAGETAKLEALIQKSADGSAERMTKPILGALTGDAGVHSEISRAHQALTALSQGTQKSNRALFDLVASKLAGLEVVVSSLPAQSQVIDQIVVETRKAQEFAAQESQHIRQSVQSSSVAFGEQLQEISALWKAAQQTNRNLLDLMDAKVAGIEASIKGASQAGLEKSDMHSDSIRQSLRNTARALSERVGEEIFRLEGAIKENTTHAVDQIASDTRKAQESVAQLGERVSTEIGKIELQIKGSGDVFKEQMTGETAKLEALIQKFADDSAEHTSNTILGALKDAAVVETIEKRLREFEKSLTGDAGVHSEISKAHQALTALSQGTQKSNRALFDLVAAKLAALEGIVSSLPAQTQKVVEISSGEITERALQESQHVRQTVQSSTAALGEQVLEISALWKAAQQTTRNLLELMDAKVAGIESSIKGSSQAVLEKADLHSDGFRHSLQQASRDLSKRVGQEIVRLEEAIRESAAHVIDEIGVKSTGAKKTALAKAPKSATTSNKSAAKAKPRASKAKPPASKVSAVRSSSRSAPKLRPAKPKKA